MRRLLLLLLTFLLPLQLMAATVGELSLHASETREHVHAAGGICPAQLLMSQAESRASGIAFESMPDLADTDINTDSASKNLPADDDKDVPTAQAECEDHILPIASATPDLPWQSFPHSFATPLSWPSFVREQLRPPPLA